MEKSWKISVEKEGAPCYKHRNREVQKHRSAGEMRSVNVSEMESFQFTLR